MVWRWATGLATVAYRDYQDWIASIITKVRLTVWPVMARNCCLIYPRVFPNAPLSPCENFELIRLPALRKRRRRGIITGNTIFPPAAPRMPPRTPSTPPLTRISLLRLRSIIAKQTYRHRTATRHQILLLPPIHVVDHRLYSRLV
jgi:hypothetical protein